MSPGSTKLLVPSLAILLALVMLPGPALAGRRSGEFTLTYEAKDGYDPFGSYDCYHEDSWHNRWWEGTLASHQSHAVNLKFCNRWVEGVSPGGTGFLMQVYGKGSYRLTATSPSGLVYEAHYFGAAKNQSHHSRCFVPPGLHVGTIEAGTWQVALHNVGGDAATKLQVHVNMASQSWQTGCPEQDRNY
jgi:hypothetical protein